MQRVALMLSLALALFGCNGSQQIADTGPDDTGNPQDATQGDGDFDAPVDIVDTHRTRDTAVEAQLDSAGGNCFLMVTPTCGPATTSFNIMGTNLQPGVQYTLIVSSPSGAGLTRQMPTAAADGTFSYTFSQSGLVDGQYSVDMNDPTFTCSFTATFTIPCP